MTASQILALIFEAALPIQSGRGGLAIHDERCAGNGLALTTPVGALARPNPIRLR